MRDAGSLTSVIGLVFVVLALSVGSATAAPTSFSSRVAASSLCTVARGVAKDIVNSTSVSNGKANPANIKATYEKIAAAEPALLGASSGALRSDLHQVFGFVNLVIADFKKVDWSPAGMAQYVPTLLPRAAQVQKPLHTLELYFHKTCKLDV